MTARDDYADLDSLGRYDSALDEIDRLRADCTMAQDERDAALRKLAYVEGQLAHARRLLAAR